MAKLAAYAQYQASQQNQAKSKAGMLSYLQFQFLYFLLLLWLDVVGLNLFPVCQWFP